MRELLPREGAPEILWGRAGVREVAVASGADLVVSAMVGAVGLEPTLAAIHAGLPVALANKETLVAAGSLVMAAAKERGVPIIPVDSEHSAIFQALHGQRPEDVQHALADRFRGAVSHLGPGAPAPGHRRPGPETSQLEHGAQDHHRFAPP